MTDEHEPVSSGIVKEEGTYDSDSTDDQMLRAIAVKIEDHGEVHAQFYGRERETELRLGTTKINYDADTFEVWDGDHYQSFPVSSLDYAYKPMETFH